VRKITEILWHVLKDAVSVLVGETYEIRFFRVNPYARPTRATSGFRGLMYMVGLDYISIHC
jgi:hypothetical protein